MQWSLNLTAIVSASLAVLVCLPPEPARAAGTPVIPQYAMTVWAAEKGAPPGDIFAVAQDLDGYLWLGTPTGLLRFDGFQFTPVLTVGKTPLPGGPVHAIVGAQDGSLWVGFGGGGGIVRIDHGTMARYSSEDGAQPGVSAMIEDRQGAIWAASRRGIYRFFENAWTLMDEDEGYGGHEAFSLYEDPAGRLWAGTGGGVYVRTKTAFELVDPDSINVQGMVQDRRGALWVTDPNEILRRVSDHTSPAHAADIQLPAGGWRLLRDRHDQIWVAAFGGGLLRITAGADGSTRMDRFDYEQRLAGSPRALYEDREGNIWVGMRGGLLRLSETSFVTAGPLEGLTNDGVRTAAVASDGSVWVATGHALNRFTGGHATAYSLSQTMALHSDRHGVMWVSTSQGIGQLVEGEFVPVAIPQEVQSSRVMAITTDSHDTLWLCSALRGVMSWDGHEVSRYGDLSNRSCQSIFTDRQDRVWVGFTAGGAVLYDKGTFQQFGEADGLTRGTVLGIIQDRSGAVWLSTSGGISRYQNGRFTSITNANAPIDDLVPVLVEDEDGYLWLGVNSGAGVLRFHPSEADKVAGNPAHHLAYALYDETDGMQRGSQTWQSGVGGVRGGGGLLWVATGLGMVVIDPKNLPPSPRPATPRIDSVIADGRRINPERGLTLPSGTSTLRMEFSTISLSSASKLRFRYMLEGFEDDWVYAGSALDATYNNVPAGSYRFRVSATQDGQWTEASTWEFSVSPPFYLTRTFFVLVIFGVMLALAAAWWLRLRAVRNQYALVFAERARVSREIHDTLLQSLAAIGVELESIVAQLDPSQTPAREGLRRLRRQVVHSLREARESIMELRHNTMKPRALVDTLRDLAAYTSRAKGVQVELSVTGRPHACSADADLQLFRIVQEAINNAIKHGRATRVTVSLAYESSRVVLSVTDNGCGFVPDEHDPAPALGEHLGLLNMRERAARIRGRLAILSTPGSGTTIETIVPLTAE